MKSISSEEDNNNNSNKNSSERSELTSGKRPLSRFLRNPISYVALFYKCYTSITDLMWTVCVCRNICIYLTIYHSHSFTFIHFIRLFLCVYLAFAFFSPFLAKFALI